MHLGNARTALLAWLQAREAGGTLVLRIEDLDTGRVRPGAEAAILEDLRWLGLDWDEGPDVGGPFGPYRQSERLDLYAAAAARLNLYPCTCSRREVLEAASAPHGRSDRYPGTCAGGVTRPGRPAALRLRVPDGTHCADDLRHGRVCSDVHDAVGDFVLRRNDGVWAYQLAVVVDDRAMGITDALRGEDLLESAPRQALLHRLLGGERPRFCHVPLLLDWRGQRLAKRAGAPAVGALRAGGADPRGIVAGLARSLGWDVPDRCPPEGLIGRFGEWLRATSPASARGT